MTVLVRPRTEIQLSPRKQSLECAIRGLLYDCARVERARIQSVCALQAVGAHHCLNSASAATTLDTLAQIFEFVVPAPRHRR